MPFASVDLARQCLSNRAARLALHVTKMNSLEAQTAGLPAPGSLGLFPGQGPVTDDSNELSGCLRLRGLPFSVQEADVRAFFRSFAVQEVFLCKRNGKQRVHRSAWVQCVARRYVSLIRDLLFLVCYRAVHRRGICAAQRPSGHARSTRDAQQAAHRSALHRVGAAGRATASGGERHRLLLS